MDQQCRRCGSGLPVLKAGTLRRGLATLAIVCASASSAAQSPVVAHLEITRAKSATHAEPPYAVFWLEPVGESLSRSSWPVRPPYQLVQKAKTFAPHVLVVPVGATVEFPNADPFFHNVFSLFNGSRFDLGLYEAGSRKDVHFNRKGISYIFCNIHSNMSAIVLALDTPLWTTNRSTGGMRISNVPQGVYEAHLWIEGQETGALTAWTHRLTVGVDGEVNAGIFHGEDKQPKPHEDKFGRPYKPDPSAY